MTDYFHAVNYGSTTDLVISDDMRHAIRMTLCSRIVASVYQYRTYAGIAYWESSYSDSVELDRCPECLASSTYALHLLKSLYK